ncbi:endonuclease IV [Clostridium thermosuccinogenes]|jgi:deoxyribonuclease-4|uniref:Endonuclease IV n=1 Tax=Clostridium thermosuccinogenes TaxID=84032 RepID=A0A2K2FIY9_9CLOT|nr:TIM barrel protein [Pseudoclostridium thermosuccinogenes]AUS96153.1 endonuclease IV [Pseudoclostridium thermosuccinogenes]PNT98733.1 endonuclease IV [Pseudoclostridium thermosuccinogenes]PNU00732.1 endonuclease IV [Pseudoclostridium thermosuccinogenes]
MIRFGPSGNSDSFYEQGYKSSVDMPEWLANMGLSAYEYQCSRGVNISESTARKLGENAWAKDIFLSVHAPYYINMASEEKEKREKSIGYVLDTLMAAKWMGAKRVVIHTGSVGKGNRDRAFKTAVSTLLETIRQADAMGYGDITLCPEVLGKMNQLGSLEEILEMCKLDERLIPTIDFGHLHARGLGALNSIDDFEKVIITIENAIGYDRLKNLHCHFSRVEFTAGGEKKHWRIFDDQYGPEFEYLAEVLIKKAMEPVIICESRNYMAEDALELKNIYENALTGVKKNGKESIGHKRA